MSASDVPIPQWNATMEGQGGYNRHSYRQAASGAAAVPLLEKAARLVDPVPSGQPVLIADYGSSQGRNSLGPLRAAIAVLRGRFGTEIPICVAHTDLPDNDFSALFRTLHTDPDSYLNGDPNAYPSAVGRSFYESVLPPAQVALGWCSSAAHWPSCIAAKVPGHYWSLRATGLDRLAFEAQCARDWRTFLSLRSRELRPTGRLVVVQGGLDEAGCLGDEALHDAANDTLAGLVADGVIGAEERSRMVIAGCGRDRTRLLEPFAENGSFAGLSVEYSELFRAPDAAWTAYCEHGDKQRLASQRARWFCATFAPTLATALEPRRPSSDQQSFADALESALTRRLTNAVFSMPTMSAAVVIVREMPGQ